jgi:hypothetical protein
MLSQTLRSRWFATLIHVSLWSLLAVALIRLGSASPQYLETTSHTVPARSPVPVARLEHLFDSVPGSKPAPAAGAPSAFATSHFVPPAPPPPTTRKVEITYLGFYQAGDDPRRVFLKMDEALVVSTTGGQIATNLFVAAAAMQTLTLTNSAAQTNVLNLNEKKVVEVPIR